MNIDKKRKKLFALPESHLIAGDINCNESFTFLLLFSNLLKHIYMFIRLAFWLQIVNSHRIIDGYVLDQANEIIYVGMRTIVQKLIDLLLKLNNSCGDIL